ncbi:MAG TPA: VWA domain-containing protein, partial [Candidatus Limnocylindrales bacterium]|nr:VWA domain-containing protein [Candidatus Limnocylindrales bacterium]
MDKRMIHFIRALRAAGVRVSLAESMDAARSIEAVGVHDREIFRAALRTTLVKEARDQGTFEYFFPLFFAQGQPPLQNIPEGMTPEQQQMLQDALQSLMGDMQALRDLLDQLLEGKPFDAQQLGDAGQRAGLPQASDMTQRQWYDRRLERQLGLEQLKQMIEDLLQQLAAMGMNAEALEQLREQLEANAAGLREQVDQYVGASMAERLAGAEPEPKPDVMDVPFTRLSDAEVDEIRAEIRRLAARLRSRSALRQRRARTGQLDTRRMMRQNMKYDSVPLELAFHTRHVKPSLVLICDISTSMRYCAEFLLTLIYELQDQVARTNSYIFISDLVDISAVFAEMEPMAAVERVLSDNRPGYYNTDLGASLASFQRDHLGVVTPKTTVIVVGDGRNNYNDPRVDLARDIQRKARRLIWFN